MDPRLKVLYEKRARFVQQQKDLLDKGIAKEGLTDEERAEHQRLAGEIRKMDELIQMAKESLEAQPVEGVDDADPQPSDANIGMGSREIKRYSLIRAISAAAEHNWAKAGLEKEASDAVAKRLGKAPRGFFVPFDWLSRDMRAEKRDLVVGTLGAGGYLKATDLLAQNFIELLRNKMMVQAAGAWVLTGLVGDIAIPRQAGGATAYWVAENGAPTEAQQTFEQVPLAPKTVGAFTDISRKLLLQSSIDIEALVRNDLATVLALAIDYAALHGSGTGNQPKGVQNQTGVAVVEIGANGGAPTWAHIINLETEVAVDNADVGALAYITNAKVRGKLKQTEKASGTAQFVWEGGNQAAPLNGYRALVTNQVRSDLTKGTGTNLSAIFYGNWRDLIIGQWGTLDILVDPYTGGTAGTVRVIAFQDVDVAVRHAESFSAILDALTT